MKKFNEMSILSGIEDLFDPFQNESCADGLSLEQLNAAWLKPSEVEEFAFCAEKLSLNGFRVARVASVQNECGYCYLPDLYGLLNGLILITIDNTYFPGDLNLLDVFLHEIAHSKTVNGEIHDWQFIVTLNLIRAECGLQYTRDKYDCCQAYNPNKNSTDEMLGMAASVASDLLSKYGYADGIQTVRFLNDTPSHSIDTSWTT